MQHLSQIRPQDISVGGRLHDHGSQQPILAHRPLQGQGAPVAGGRSFPHPFPAGRATVAPGHLRRLAALIDKHPVPRIDLLYLLLRCLAPPPFFGRVLVQRAERLYLAAGSSAGAGATYAAY